MLEKAILEAYGLKVQKQTKVVESIPFFEEFQCFIWRLNV